MSIGDEGADAWNMLITSVSTEDEVGAVMSSYSHEPEYEVPIR
jgi:hypothetical protein